MRGLKCLNPSCTYTGLTSYDSVCPKCGTDQYYLYHYGTKAKKHKTPSNVEET